MICLCLIFVDVPYLFHLFHIYQGLFLKNDAVTTTCVLASILDGKIHRVTRFQHRWSHWFNGVKNKG